MIGTNEIIEIINVAVPALATSPVLIKLIDTAYKVFKTLYMLDYIKKVDSK